MTGFTAYIDESGCDGFDFDGGSTDFIVIGAVIFRTSKLSQFEEAVAAARPLCRKADDWTFGSFKDLRNSQSQRWILAKCFSALKCQVVAVAVHKPSLQEEGWREKKSDLYFQASKFLVERISWSCRDTHSVLPESDPRVRIIFSKRGHLRFEEFAQYMRVLRGDPSAYSTNADWNHLDPDLVESEQHSDANPCHLAADHFAAAVGAAINHIPAQMHMFDDRFARLWANRFYKANGRIVGNGFKIWPNEGYNILKVEPRGEWAKLSLQW